MGLDFSKHIDVILEGSWLELTSKTGSKYHKFSSVAKEYALYIASKLVPPDFDVKKLPLLAQTVGLLPEPKGVAIQSPSERAWHEAPHPKAGTVSKFDPLFDPTKDVAIDPANPHASRGAMGLETFPSEYYVPPGQEIPAKVSTKHNQLLFSIKTTSYQILTKPEKQPIFYISIPGSGAAKKEIVQPSKGPKMADLDDKITEAITSDVADDKPTMPLPDRHSTAQKNKKDALLKSKLNKTTDLDKELSLSLGTEPKPTEPETAPETQPEPERATDTIWSRKDKYVIIPAQPSADKRYTHSVNSITIDPENYIDINHSLLQQGQIRDLRDNNKISIKNIKLGTYEVWRIHNNTDKNIALDTEPVVLVAASHPVAVEVDRVNAEEMKRLVDSGLIEIETKKEPKQHVNREKMVKQTLSQFPLKLKVKPAAQRDIGDTSDDKMITLTHFIIDFQQPIGEFTPSEEALEKDAEKLDKATQPKSSQQPTNSKQFKELYSKHKGPTVDDL